MISVCLACYNGESYIKKQIDSILPQLNPTDELLISDDGSSDGTLEILKHYNDKRITIYHNRFKNHIKNFEFLLNKVEGDFIFLSDQDDIWVNNKVEIMLENLKNFDLVLSDCTLINGEDEVIVESLFGDKIPTAGFAKNFYKNIYTGCCMAFNKKIKNLSLPFPEKINSHDMWIGMVSELRGNVKVLDDKLILFRRHGKNFSASVSDDTFLSKKSPYSMLDILKHRIYMGSKLIKVLFKHD
ncbi:glycosyltransferase family 2 protein [Chryseobacterium mulctrae]|uniref:glycosyltransferase family 2 protein n=1 Tax=Chryseobacterium mulctrae TaxID=2576777 RepID=UPI0011178174|nr:glycosyltransferase family 2 protein [Chryseobacterium mulctrae]